MPEHMQEMALISLIVEVLKRPHIGPAKELDAVCGALIDGIRLGKTRMNDADHETWCAAVAKEIREGLAA